MATQIKKTNKPNDTEKAETSNQEVPNDQAPENQEPQEPQNAQETNGSGESQNVVDNDKETDSKTSSTPYHPNVLQNTDNPVDTQVASSNTSDSEIDQQAVSSPVPSVETVETVVTEETHSSKWIVIIIALILLIIAASGGAFFYLTQYKYAGPVEIVSPESEIPVVNDANVDNDSQTKTLENLNTSDEITDIESDLDDTKLENLDQELDEIDQQL